MQSCAFREEIWRMVNNLLITVRGFLYSGHTCDLPFIISQSSITLNVHPLLYTSPHDARAMKFGLLLDIAPSSQLKPVPLREKLVTKPHSPCCSKSRIETNYLVSPVKKRETGSFPFSASQDCQICPCRKFSKAHDEQRQLLFQNEEGSSEVTFSFSQGAWG